MLVQTMLWETTNPAQKALRWRRNVTEYQQPQIFLCTAIPVASGELFPGFLVSCCPGR
jgi:hypothetical protein